MSFQKLATRSRRCWTRPCCRSRARSPNARAAWPATSRRASSRATTTLCTAAFDVAPTTREFMPPSSWPRQVARRLFAPRYRASQMRAGAGTVVVTRLKTTNIQMFPGRGAAPRLFADDGHVRADGRAAEVRDGALAFRSADGRADDGAAAGSVDGRRRHPRRFCAPTFSRGPWPIACKEPCRRGRDVNPSRRELTQNPRPQLAQGTLPYKVPCPAVPVLLLGGRRLPASGRARGRRQLLPS